MNQDSLIRATLDFPWQLRAYEHWLAARSGESDDYLYSRQRVRFTPRDEDELAIPDGLTIDEAGTGINVSVPGTTTAFQIPGLERGDAEKLISALWSRPTVIELPFASGLPAEVCDRLINLAFGRFIFAPEALTQLEAATNGAEIVRFPGSPYEIVRNYWINVGHLNSAIEQSLFESRSSISFVDWLRGLHVLLLLGEDLKTFYCPSSPVALKRVEPGALFTVASRTLKTSHGEFIVEGPRVNASALGGSHYDTLIARSLGVHPSASTSKTFALAGTSWGRLITARARAEAQDRQWYLPPRPLSEAYWREIFTTWNAAVEATDKQQALRQLGRFHWCFVHLHPFSCANQSLAFALVNWQLRRLATSGIPHLILDQLALRHDCADYVRLFVRAVSAWNTGEVEPAARHMERVRKRQVLDEFVARIAMASSESEANQVARADGYSAQLALLLDSGPLFSNESSRAC